MIAAIYKVLLLALTLARPIPLKVSDVLTGPETEANPGVHLITNRQDWHAMWGEHKDVLSTDLKPVELLAAPQFDFSKVAIIAVVSDSRPATSGFEVDKLELAKDGWQMHLTPIATPAGGAQVIARPFAFFVVNRFDRPLHLWVDEGGRQPTRIAQFPALIKRKQ